MQAIEAHLEYLTRQTRVNDLICQGGCDSATLYIAKFPYVMSSKNLNDKDKAEVEAKKKKELQDFCRRVERSKQFIDSSLLLPEIPNMISFTAVNKGRLLVNHTGGIVENGNLALHRFFDCPIISGSALKGIARNAARFDADKERFARVFGGEEKGESKEAGSVSFLMAIPENTNWKLVVDVLTSHGGSDTQNPVPVFFPAVETGATFRFTVAPTARTKDGDLEFAVKYLKEALSENGVGAKTAAGYGWFEIPIVKSELDIVKEWGYTEIVTKVQEAAALSSIEAQRCYLERMIKDKASNIRKWKQKGNPNFELLTQIAQKCGLELPE